MRDGIGEGGSPLTSSFSCDGKGVVEIKKEKKRKKMKKN